MPPKGSGSQASTLVSRGGAAGAVAAGPRATAGAVAPRRRTPVRAARSFFMQDDSPLLELTPTQVIYFAITFICVVFGLHIVGKIRGA